MLRKMRNTEGFTLIELMIVIAIIGILAAIAIPNFVSYRQRSYNSAAQTDLKNAMTTQEAYFVDNEIYADTVNKLTAAGLRQSSNVTFESPDASTTGYTMTAYHTSGNVTWHVAGPDSSMTSN